MLPLFREQRLPLLHDQDYLSEHHRVDQRANDEGVLKHIASVARKDRVYAVALDEKGKHMLVGGRDKKVALYCVTGVPVPDQGPMAKELEAKNVRGAQGGLIGGASVVWEVTADVCALASIRGPSGLPF